MNLMVNGESEILDEGVTLADLVARTGIPEEGLVTVVGDDVIAPESRSAMALKEGMKVELLNFVSGG